MGTTAKGYRQLRTGGVVTASILAALAFSAPAQAAPLALTPWPASVEQGSGKLLVASGSVIAVPAGDADAAEAARLLADHVKRASGLVLDAGSSAGSGGGSGAGSSGAAPIRFERDAAISGAEAYRLTVTSGGAVISASGKSGFIYGAMTLLQLLTADAGSAGKSASVPVLTIQDSPRFSWRGVMVDPSRHFQPMESVYAIVDRMVEVKLNTLHFHLSDDQGWRFEVKRYPELTRIGAWRLPPDTGGAIGPRSGGFYTQEQLKALVAYAAERGITVVPEIDLPGHAQALVASYPEVGVLGDRPAVSHDWGVNPWLFNPNDAGMTFVRNVLDELMEVFPSQFIHIGGDEAVKDQWERSPEVQSQMRKLGIKTENEMQSWMIDRFGEYLAQHGRRLIGWDEILEGGLPASASVMSWRGEQGAVDAANAGHDVVLTPAPNLYLDNLESTLPDEAPGRISIQTMEAVYRYDPMPKGIDAAKAKHVLGVQGNAWSEYIVTPWQLQHKLFPRVGALAETAWSPVVTGEKDYPGFLARLTPQIQRWKQGGFEVSDSAFGVAFTPTQTRAAQLDAKSIGVALANQASYGTIRYTLDGKAPAAKSPAYAKALVVKPGTVVTAASFAPDGTQLSAPRRYDTARETLLTSTASTLVACPRGAQGLRVPLTADATANGPAYNVNIFDTCQADDHAPLAHAKTITVSVARLPRNYGLAHEASALIEHFAVTTHGELVISAGCRAAEKAANRKQKEHAPMPGATVLATFALPDPDASPQQYTFTANLPDRPELKDEADVCFQFTSPLSDPFYAVEKVVYGEKAK
ncbi:family 20 glycosylhydrolase [Novosphingobium sp. ST904]|uniref:beta-N-acetylhexosaminidase n=1 Tax=Novosphingobium sp. ST904 TaxID=1684385 RepID=UPI0006C8A955|nr:family 20 glycosylhydrolase [Novosphingobium sp. ST904]KPH66580.1 beta-hexosaminidase [Novosphingobium sp. ST904]TCM41549.1 hexosaminidase [Novosphingobium sp. ST904]